MKKVTLVFLILFGITLTGVFAMGLIYPSNGAKQSVVTTSLPDGSMVVTNDSGKASTTVPPGGFTMVDVGKHNVKSDCYLVIDSKVYDVTKYFGKHPGGTNSILSRCGQEASGIFASIHSNFAWNLLNDYYLVDLGDAATTSSIANSGESKLNDITTLLNNNYPGAEIIGVKPKNDFYVGKIIKDGILLEIHIDSNGNVLSEEVENDEYDWETWDTDEDDNVIFDKDRDHDGDSEEDDD